MEILVVTNLFPNPTEPLRSTFNERQVYELSRLANVRVISPVDWLRKLSLLKNRKLKALKNCKTWNGIPVHYPTYFHIPKFNPVIFGPLMFLSLLYTWIRISKNKNQIIFATWAYPDGFAAVLLSKISSLPICIKVHGSDVENMDGNKLLKRATVWTLNNCNLVISVSEYLKDKMVKHGVNSELISVVRNGVQKNLFKSNAYAPSVQAKHIIYIGNFKRDKGIFTLLEAISILDKQTDTHITLTMLGDGPDFQSFKDRLAELNLDKTICLKGRVTPDVVSKELSQSMVLVLPSFHEGMPNVIIEALHVGIPVIATQVGGIPEIITNTNGVLVKPGDAELLASAISNALKKNWKKSEILQSAEVFKSWEDNAKDLFYKFNHILNGEYT